MVYVRGGFSLSAADNSVYPRTQSFRNSWKEHLNLKFSNHSITIRLNLFPKSPIAKYINLVAHSAMVIISGQLKSKDGFLLSTNNVCAWLPNIFF